MEQPSELMVNSAKGHKRKNDIPNQLSLFDFNSNEDILMELRELNLNMLTPMDAMNKLYELQLKVKEQF
jgi:DNA mismatch repair protein MutS